MMLILRFEDLSRTCFSVSKSNYKKNKLLDVFCIPCVPLLQPNYPNFLVILDGKRTHLHFAFELS